ncbi:MAG TPA: hypothetical protein VNQ57_10665 [Ureibacillus sp.]|nr:hypothetical protein [Ureibacillus sp.]
MSEQDYKSLNVDEVLLAVRNEQISAEEALLFEKEGKARKSLIEALNVLVNPDEEKGTNEESIEDEQEHPAFVTVKFIANVKIGPNLHKVGKKLEVTQEDYDTFVKAGVILKENE